IWGGDSLAEWGKSFWELEPQKGFQMLATAVNTHIITSRYGVPLMRKSNEGLIVEITDGDFAGYRGNLFYDLAKNSVIRLAYAMSCELRETQITALALTPGFLRSEAMLDHFGVDESNWQDGIEQDPYFAESETPCYVGRAVAALAADPNVKEKAGKVWASWTLAKEYNFTDIDGRQPDFPAFFDLSVKQMIDKGGPANEQERMLLLARYHQIHLDPRRSQYAKQLENALGLMSIGN
ncbi:MAG: SDR family NAD(P)-dependent oxidoreductase, partial [Candidatus Obscuribacterales bacterium]|nr:SDR family NAD(P)-dependent oxidoreductase [Candidatus Obscuribacterales bacterium]